MWLGDDLITGVTGLVGSPHEVISHRLISACKDACGCPCKVAIIIGRFLTKIGMCRHILINLTSIKSHENKLSCSRVITWADRHGEVVGANF